MATDSLPIYDITNFTMLDYPDELACIVWFAGCNMRCPYCYNPAIVSSKGNKTEEELLDFLKTRQMKLDGVVLSGGECTMYPKLHDLCKKIKDLDFLIKLDTNGSNPTLVEKLIHEKLIDYVALDFKAPAAKYQNLTKLPKGFDHFEHTLKILLNSSINYEVRTTVHADILNESDISAMAEFLYSKGYNGTFYLQNFMETEVNIGDISKPEHTLNIENINSPIPIELRNF